MNKNRDERGFVLILVLVTVALLSAAAIGMILQTRSSGDDAALHLKAVEARALLDAASARVFHAITASDDPLPVWQAPGGKPLRWEFNGRTVEMSIEDESAKADLNHAPPELVLGLMAAADLGARSARHISENFLGLRHTQTAIPSPSSLLGPCDRLSGGSRELEAYVTVLTASAGVSTSGMTPESRAHMPDVTALDLVALDENARARTSSRDDPRLAHIHRLLADQTGIATLSLRPDASFGLARERRVAFGQMLREPFVFQIRAVDLNSARKDLCG